MHRLLKDDRILDELQTLIKNLNNEYESGSLIVVEGPRDARALKTLGFSGKPFLLCYRNSVAKLVDEAGRYRKVVLLLDFDLKGRELTKKVASAMERRRKKVDLFYRRRLLEVTEGMFRRIEDLSAFKDLLQPEF